MLVDVLNRRVPGFWRLNRAVRVTLTGSPIREPYRRGDFYSPLPDLGQVAAAAATLFDADPAAPLPGIDLNDAGQRALLDVLAATYPQCPFLGPDHPGHPVHLPATAPGPRPRFHLDQGYFLHGDAIALFGLLRHVQPRRVVEVGSGFSSALMLDTAERFLDHPVTFTFIDPHPQRLRALLRPADQTSGRVTVLEQPVQRVPLDAFTTLAAGDVLFLDSSHVSKCGSDVNWLFFQVLPRLAPGVVVHVHDIHWPFEYRRQWVEQGRAWNEAYLLRAFLTHNTAWEVLWWNQYVAARYPDALRAAMPAFLLDPGGSFYLRRRLPI